MGCRGPTPHANGPRRLGSFGPLLHAERGEVGQDWRVSLFNVIWPYLVVALGVLVALMFGFDIGGVATRFAGSSERFWTRMPTPWSHVNRPNYWRVVGVEIGGFIVLVGVLFAIVLRST